MDALKQLIEQKKQTTNSLLRKREEKDRAPDKVQGQPSKSPQKEEGTPSKIEAKIFDLDSFYDLEEIRNEVLKELPAKRTKYDDSEAKPQTWDFTVTEGEMALLTEHNSLFKERFAHQKSFDRKFDFGADKEYDEKCDDVKIFTIHQVAEYDQYIKERSKATEKTQVDAYLKELEIFKSMRSDLLYLIQQLSDRVTSLGDQ